METIYVIMPVYNAAKFLSRSIRSVLTQSFRQFRLLLVDDGSTDASGKICDRFAQKDSRITVIHQKNQGSFLARKSGVLQCPDAVFVTFLDADDVLLPDALQLLWDGMQNSRADVCTGGMKRMWRNRFFQFNPCTGKESDIDRETFFQRYFCSWYGITSLPVSLYSKLYKAVFLKKAYVQIPEDLTHFYGDDLLVTLHYFVQCDRIHMMDREVYGYRIGGGTAKYRPDMMREFFSLYTYKLEFAKDYPAPQDLRLLSDIELCYITSTYAKLLYAAPHYTKKDRLDDLKNVMRHPLLKNAAQNVLQSDFRDKRNAQWIADEDAEAMLAAAKPTAKDKLKRLLYRLG